MKHFLLITWLNMNLFFFLFPPSPSTEEMKQFTTQDTRPTFHFSCLSVILCVLVSAIVCTASWSLGDKPIVAAGLALAVFLILLLLQCKCGCMFWFILFEKGLNFVINVKKNHLTKHFFSWPNYCEWVWYQKMFFALPVHNFAILLKMHFWKSY